MVAAAKGRIYAKQRRDAKKRPHSEGSKENTKPSDQQPGCSQTKTKKRSPLSEGSEENKMKSSQQPGCSQSQAKKQAPHFAGSKKNSVMTSDQPNQQPGGSPKKSKPQETSFESRTSSTPENSSRRSSDDCSQSDIESPEFSPIRSQ